jgi:predicted O-methyltransferase YrrM
MIRPLLQYLLRARDEHALHSPFLYDLYTTVIRPRPVPMEPVFTDIEAVRHRMRASTDEIEVRDFGAGSKHSNAPRRRVSVIARNAEKPPKYGQLLYRLIRRFRPETILDLGTSLGITTLYEAAAAQAAAAPTAARLLSFEGCPETARLARQNFETLGGTVVPVELVIGNLDETLPECVGTLDRVDFAFFDANHRYEPTVRYFETCLTSARTDSVFVFDDIHWSPEMERAWRYIKAHPRVTVTVDLFQVGLVFFRTEQPKQHFVLRY